MEPISDEWILPVTNLCKVDISAFILLSKPTQCLIIFCIQYPLQLYEWLGGVLDWQWGGICLQSLRRTILLIFLFFTSLKSDGHIVLFSGSVPPFLVVMQIYHVIPKEVFLSSDKLFMSTCFKSLTHIMGVLLLPITIDFEIVHFY